MVEEIGWRVPFGRCSGLLDYVGDGLARQAAARICSLGNLAWIAKALVNLHTEARCRSKAKLSKERPCIFTLLAARCVSLSGTIAMFKPLLRVQSKIGIRERSTLLSRV